MGREKRRQVPRQPSRRIVGAGDRQAIARELRVGGHVTGRAVPPARKSARGHSERLRPPLGREGWAAVGRGREAAARAQWEKRRPGGAKRQTGGLSGTVAHAHFAPLRSSRLVSAAGGEGVGEARGAASSIPSLPSPALEDLPAFPVLGCHAVR